jgi:hypothetical protein
VETVRGVELGVFQADTDEAAKQIRRLVDQLKKVNLDMREQANRDDNNAYVSTDREGRQRLRTFLTNLNGATGEAELVLVTTVSLGQNRALYLLGTFPLHEIGLYATTYESIRESLQISGEPSATKSAPGGTVAPSALVGAWRAEGIILELRADRSFARVSNSSFGALGGVLGVDDSGSYEVHGDQIVLHGHGLLRERTCSYSQAVHNNLVCDGVTYVKK